MFAGERERQSERQSESVSIVKIVKDTELALIHLKLKFKEIAKIYKMTNEISCCLFVNIFSLSHSYYSYI